MYECNEFDSLHNVAEGLSILYNADIHEIRGNEFLNCGTDLTIKSVTGIQEHHGNIFVNGDCDATELSLDELFSSRFIVNDQNPNESRLLPSNPNPNDWFDIDLSTVEYFDCVPNASDPNNVDVEFLCNYYNNLKAIQATKPNQFFVRLQHLLKMESVDEDYQLPDCIKSDSVLLNLCGILDITAVLNSLDDIVALDVVLDSTYAEEVAIIKERDIIDSLDRVIYRAAVDSLRAQALAEIVADSISFDSLQTAVSLISCTDSIVSIWKTSLRTYIDFVRSSEVHQREKQQLGDISKMCSDTYGDAVHLARTLVNTYDDTYLDTYDDCTVPKTGAETRSTVVPIVEMTLYPNPNDGSFYLKFDEEFTGDISVMNTQGHQILKLTLDRKKDVQIDFVTNSGLYFIESKSVGGNYQVKKIFVYN